MKTRSRPQPDPTPVLRQDDIRDYAEHLYQQGGRMPGHDLDNWLESEACLRCHLRPSPPARHATGFTMPASDASMWTSDGGKG
jgi:hypothetical protein